MSIYSVKMRASRDNNHISGSEKLVDRSFIGDCVSYMVERGMNHEKGRPDFMNIKVEEINEQDILHLQALPVTTREVESVEEGMSVVDGFLRNLGVHNIDGVMECLKKTYSMRGAMLLNVDTMAAMEPDNKRGIRATYMDRENSVEAIARGQKDHYGEAIVLASKVINAPGIIGEICISDDPAYVTGYVASKETGYVRITKMKEMGSELGGRIFLFRGDEVVAEKTIHFLEKQPVIVEGVKPLVKEEKSEDKWRFAKDSLAKLKDEQLYRSMKTISSPQSHRVICQEKEMIMLASNHYLDMANVKEVKEAAIRAVNFWGAGSGGSRLTTGNCSLHEKLEQELARFKNCEASLLFNTGYVANLSVISALMDENSVIYSDALNHASIIDGCRLSKAKIVVYEHNDMEDLERKINAYKGKRGMLVSDAVFSMDGDILNLPEYVRIGEKYQLLTMVDEAHSTGVIGRTGKGIVEYYEDKTGKKYKPDIIMGTLSKALGSEGGFVCGSRILIEYLKNKARGFIFSTSQSPANVAAANAALKYLIDNPRIVAELQDNVHFFCNEMKGYGIELHSETAIIPILIGDEERAVAISEKLAKKGIFLSAIRYPTVARKSARLRVALMSGHTKEELKKAAEEIAEAIREETAY